MAGLCAALQSYRAVPDTPGCDSGTEQSCYSSVSTSDIKLINDLPHTKISLFIFQMKIQMYSKKPQQRTSSHITVTLLQLQFMTKGKKVIPNLGYDWNFADLWNLVS